MNDSFLDKNGQPDLSCLIETFNRCAPPMSGGIDWLDQVRLCNGPTDSFDGRKHSAKEDPNGKAFPWDGASNCKPFTADDVIEELSARDLSAFWRAMIQRGASTTDEGGYAVALVEHLVFGPMMAQLDKEVELSTQLRHSRGWCLLAPRWKIEFGLKAYELDLKTIQQLELEAQQALEQFSQLPPEQQQQAPAPAVAKLQQQAQLVSIILDPTRDEEAKEFLKSWYDSYVKSEVPEKFQSRVPKVTSKVLNKVLTGLRGPEARARVPIPYLCKNQLEITALEPWREVCLPNEMTDVQEVVFQLEYVTATTLEGRVLGEGYSQAWVDEAKKLKTVYNWSQLPVRAQALGVGGLLRGGPPDQHMAVGQYPDGKNGLICIVHAVYKALDADGIPSGYCTTFHPDIKGSSEKPLLAKHELVETVGNELPYVELVLEWRNRAITSSRSIQEKVATQQKLIKDTLDQIIDRGSITILPPVNTYESPTGGHFNQNGPAIGDLEFGPGAQNRFRRKETAAEFMQMPSGQGMTDGVEVYKVIQSQVNNRFGLMSEDVPAPRMQILQEKSVRRFLVAWTRAFVYGLALCQKHMEDAEFSRITGAPEGWLEARRNDPNALQSVFDFDVRELDSEQFVAQIKAMEETVLPQDSMSVVDRAKWTETKSRGIMGTRVASNFLRPLPDASQALKEKAELMVHKMYLGTPATLLDKEDPTAASLLQMTQETVLNNPKFSMALTEEALLTVTGNPEQAQMQMMKHKTLAQQMQQAGQEPPDQDMLFSALLTQWLENLKFQGVTQQQNKQTGRTGVDAAPQPA